MFRYFVAKIKRFLVKFLSMFLPISQMRKDFRHKFFLDIYEMPTSNSYYYGKIYMPYYPNFKMQSIQPDIYNKNGQKMELFFLRDRMGSSVVYSGSKYFEYDRYNIDLDTHIYTGATMLETMGYPKEKYGIFLESETIIPHEYTIFKKHKGLEKDFDGIFTFSEELLETVNNAKFFPFCATVWYSKETYNGKNDPVSLNPDIWQTKNKNISMICSNKQLTKMHKLRHYFANEAMKTGKIDIFGGINNGTKFNFKSQTLKDYRYQIVVENDIKPYYFTEKILDCFASMTIPIYLGATKVDKFFNPGGIITITEKTDIEQVLKMCTEEEYQNRINAVKENYEKSLKYLNTNDLLYETYFMKRHNKDKDKDKEEIDLFKILQH